MKKHIINIDKLQLSYKNDTIKIINKNDFIAEYMLQNDKLYSNNYHSSIRIYYKDIHYFTIYNKLKSCINHSSIKVLNERLYTKNWNAILTLFLKTYKIIDYNYSNIEICINTNDILTTKYINNFKNNKIRFNEKSYNHYDCKDFGQTIDFITKDFSKRTFYIYNTKKKLKVLRIENKTNEIETSSKKNYILDYYKANGLNITKDIYRLELSLKINDIKDIISTKKYKHTTSNDAISSRQFKKLDKLERLNYSVINYVRDYKKSIDIQSLTDELFLTKLFNSFVMINYSILIKTATNKKLDFKLIRKDEMRAERAIEIDYEYLKETSLEYDSLFN